MTPPLPRLRGAGGFVSVLPSAELNTYPTALKPPARRPLASRRPSPVYGPGVGPESSVAEGRHTETALHATDTFFGSDKVPRGKMATASKTAQSWDNTALFSEWLAHALFSKNNQKTTGHQESSEQAQGATTNSDQKRRCFV